MLLLTLLTACTPSPAPSAPAPPPPAEATAKPRGCPLDDHATSECFATTVSPEHHDLARGVGGARQLRERLAAAGVRTVTIADGDTTLATLHFDDLGRFVRQEGSSTWEATYDGDDRIRSTTSARHGVTWSTATLASDGPGRCTRTETVGPGPERTIRCEVDGDAIVRAGRFGEVRGTRAGRTITYDNGAVAEEDAQGRRILTRTVAETLRYTYAADRTTETRTAPEPERTNRAWHLDDRGLPVEIRHLLYDPPLVWTVSTAP